jgi:hypothetical protein
MEFNGSAKASKKDWRVHKMYMDIDEIYNIIDNSQLDTQLQKALLALVLKVEKLQPKDAGFVAPAPDGNDGER